MHELTKQVVQLVALPMKAAGAEAAPTRVIAMEDTDG
jgi:arylformamidase